MTKVLWPGFGNLKNPAIAWAGGSAPPPVPQQLTVTVAPASLDTDDSWLTTDGAWSNRSNVLVNDATAATWTSPGSANRGSQLLHVRFAATSIPTDAVITGMEVNYRASATGSVSLSRAYLTNNGKMCNYGAYTSTATTFTALATRTLGANGFTFGTPLTPAAINAGNIGFAIRFFRTAVSVATVSLEYIDLKVFYTTVLGKSSRNMAVAQVLVPMEADGMTGGVLRASFPDAAGRTPSAILYYSSGIRIGDRANYLTRLLTKASVVSGYGMAVPGKNTGGRSWLNNAGTFAGASASSHDPRAVGFVGQGGSNQNYTLWHDSGNSRCTPTNFGAEYVDFAWNGSLNEPMLITVVAIYATSVDLYLDDGFPPPSGPYTRTVTCGFQPNLLLCLTLPDRFNSAAHDAYTTWSFGAAKWSGSAWVNQGIAATVGTRETVDIPPPTAQAMTASKNSWELMTDAFVHDWNCNDAGVGVEGTYSNFNYRKQASARSATGYTITTMQDLSVVEDNIAVLALDMGSVPFDFGFFDLPTATGAATLATTFKPSGMIAALTNAVALGRSRQVPDTGAWSLTMAGIDGAQQATNGHFSADATPAPSLTSNRVHDQAGLTMIGASAATTFQATVTEFSASGVKLDVTTAAPASTKGFALFIG